LDFQERKPEVASRTFYEKYALLIMAMFFFVAPVVFTFAARTVRSNSNKVEDWLPSDFPETSELAWFREHFVGEQFVILSWEGCRLGKEPNAYGATGDDPRIENLAAMLVPKQPKEDSIYGKYFKSVTTGRRALDQLTAPPLNIPYEEAVARLTGSLIGPDGHQTCMVIHLTKEASKHFRHAIGRGKTQVFKSRQTQGVLFDALEACRIDTEKAYIGGPPADNVAIDEEGEKTLLRLAGLSGLLGIGLAWISLKSVRLTIIVLACGLLSTAAALAIVSLTGNTSDAVMLSMPSLVYVLAISGAVHLINYYKDAVKRNGYAGAPEEAISHGWKPALLCSVTTALGLISLYSSNLVPIRKFGLFAASGVLVTFVVLFAYLPAALYLWPDPLPKKPARNRQGEQSRFKKWLQRFGTSADHFWGRCGMTIIRHHGLVAFGCLLFIGIIGAGIAQVRTSIDLMKLFDSKARIIHDYEWLEANVGRLVPMELVVRFQPEAIRPPVGTEGDRADDNQKLNLLERMETIVSVQQALDKRFGKVGEDVIGPCMSATTFAPDLPDARGDTKSLMRRYATNTRLEESHGKLLETDYLRIDKSSGEELWRLSLRVAAFQDIDYGTFAHDVRNVVEPILEAQRQRLAVVKELAHMRNPEDRSAAKICIWDSSPASDESQYQRAFVDALQSNLKASRMRVAYVRRAVDELPALPIEKLGQFDLVLLTGNFSIGKLDELRVADVQFLQLEDLSQELALDDSVASVGKKNLSMEPISAVYTGVVPIVYKAQRTLLSSLIDSTIWSFLTITPLLMFVSRGFSAGLVTMLPNVLPVIVVFGGMGWLGVQVDIGSMMAASIALGVAVDDTIHYLTWFRQDLKKTRNRQHAIIAAYRHCATPTLQSAMINGLGLAVFAFSTFTPTKMFGYLMLTILVAGVVAELIMLPALLAGPLGRAFKIPPAEEEDESNESLEFAADTEPWQHVDGGEVVLSGPHRRGAERKPDAIQRSA
jgi:predicted RND superfamily exporter protein